jgi:hypothetical protein
MKLQEDIKSKTWANIGEIGLKRPNYEICGSGDFTQIRPVWVGGLGTF